MKGGFRFVFCFLLAPMACGIDTSNGQNETDVVRRKLSHSK